MADLAGVSWRPDDGLWALWEAGFPQAHIGRVLDKDIVTVHKKLARHGGIAPRVQRRAARALSLLEREEISRGMAAGLTMRAIAAELGRVASTISREVQRHGGRTGYRALDADTRAWKRAARPKPCILAQRPRLRAVVSSKLEQDWSPRQTSCWLKAKYPDEPTMHVSHETIYRSLFVQGRGALRQELTRHLRSGHVMRFSKKATKKGRGHGQILDAVSISQRPPEAADRAVPGHWEGDLLMGGRSSHIGTLVERRSRFLMLVKIDKKDAPSVAAALAKKVRKLPAELRRTLTWDRGSEMAAHKEFTVATDVKVYFCDPRSPWQRGSNENTNGLLRQYFPKSDDLTKYSQADLNKIAAKLNGRPRETLGWKNPAESFSSSVASTP